KKNGSVALFPCNLLAQRFRCGDDCFLMKQVDILKITPVQFRSQKNRLLVLSGLNISLPANKYRLNIVFALRHNAQSLWWYILLILSARRNAKAKLLGLSSGGTP